MTQWAMVYRRSMAPGLKTEVTSRSRGGMGGMSVRVRMGLRGCRVMRPPFPTIIAEPAFLDNRPAFTY